MTEMKMKKALFGSLALFAFLLVFPQAVFGIGQTTDPIIINDALRGQTIQREVIVVNTEKTESVIAIMAEGDIADWAKFFDKSDLENPITEMTMDAGATKNVLAEITVPEDVKNGEYLGSIGVTKKTENEINSESSASVSQKINRKVEITVSDDENISIKVSVIPEKYDLEEKESIKVRVIYDNQGNVAVRPDMNVKIKRDDKALFSITYPFSEETQSIKPKAVSEVPRIEIPTATLDKGNYTAEVDFVVDQKTISTESFKFSIGASVNGANDNFKSLGFLDRFGSGLVLAGIIFAALIAVIIRKRMNSGKVNSER
jgi:uncharacterized membrane protein